MLDPRQSTSDWSSPGIAACPEKGETMFAARSDCSETLRGQR